MRSTLPEASIPDIRCRGRGTSFELETVPMVTRKKKQRKPPAAARRPRTRPGPTARQVSPARPIAAQQIEAYIRDNHLPPMARLPREAVLAAELGITRHALRRGVAALVARGVLRNAPGIGSFVAPQRIVHAVAPGAGICDALERAGLKPRLRVVSETRGTAPADVARGLGIAARTEVVEIVQVVSGNDIPLVCATIWAPADRFQRLGHLTDALGSLRNALAQLGIAGLAGMSARISSRLANADERQRLGLTASAVVTVLEGTCSDATGEPAYAFHQSFIAERFELAFEL